jgi:hypothetical protein
LRLVREPITADAAGASEISFFGTSGRGFGFFRGLTTAVSGVGFTTFFGSPTSAPRGGGSGARRTSGSNRTPISATTTIAATFATPRHLIRTPAIAP